MRAGTVAAICELFCNVGCEVGTEEEHNRAIQSQRQKQSSRHDSLTNLLSLGAGHGRKGLDLSRQNGSGIHQMLKYWFGFLGDTISLNLQRHLLQIRSLLALHAPLSMDIQADDDGSFGTAVFLLINL